MNLCTDQMVLLLAGRDRIASISWLGADPAESPLAELAKGLSINHGLAEEVIAAKPDLVLAGRYTTGFAKAMLRRLHYPVVEIDSPNTIADIAVTFRAVGAAVAERERAEALLAGMERRLKDVSRRAAGQIAGSAIVYDANGFTVGRPGLADDVMTLLGLRNRAPDLGIGAYGQVPLESMLAVRPDHIIHLVYRPGEPSMASAAINHPALRGSRHDRRPVEIMGHMFTCGTPLIADAAEQLHMALLGKRPQ
jgi:iron complex transport system substrate-binding protein